MKEWTERTAYYEKRAGLFEKEPNQKYRIKNVFADIRNSKGPVQCRIRLLK